MKSQMQAQTGKDGKESGSAAKSSPIGGNRSGQPALFSGVIQRQSAFDGLSAMPAASQVLQMQQALGNRATMQLLRAGMESNTDFQSTAAPIQREKVLPDPVTEVQVQPLLTLVESQRQKISTLQRAKGLSFGDQESLDKCWTKLTVLYGRLRETDNPMGVWEEFTEWTETSAWSGGGMEHWDTFVSLSLASEPKEEEASETDTSGEGVFSPECESVFSDMNTQYKAWNGSTRDRGAWWGSPRPGSTTGARSVPHDVIMELKKRVKGTTWRFSDSFSGGVSFHRTRSGVDFIYHMLPPG
ncbi:hypothetical protein [Paenibacillus sp. HB172176]|uniref:hypothetical protein n=1 Tax=Paenibacillus sp. HB172176 TaxID=2493690 RepID=UPI00143C6617|nr:hypothetical protein [Paenibacillus sp. HB172176]